MKVRVSIELLVEAPDIDEARAFATRLTCPTRGEMKASRLLGENPRVVGWAHIASSLVDKEAT